jgi:ankyrin repeat protein
VALSKLSKQIDAVAGSNRWVKCDHGCLKDLLGAGLDVNGQAPNGDTALLIAVQKDVRLLLDRGAQVNTADGQRSTPLMLAVMTGQPANARELLARGADIHAKNAKGFTALAVTGFGSVGDFWFTPVADSRAL